MEKKISSFLFLLVILKPLYYISTHPYSTTGTYITYRQITSTATLTKKTGLAANCALMLARSKACTGTWWMAFGWFCPPQLAWLGSGLTGTLQTDWPALTGMHLLPGSLVWSALVWTTTTPGSLTCWPPVPAAAQRILVDETGSSANYHHLPANSLRFCLFRFCFEIL